MSQNDGLLYTTEPPKPPAAFLAPQTCPPGRCRFPGTPLPPPSPIILAALDKAFFAQMRRELASRCFALVEEKKWDSRIAGARIMELARAGLSPDEILARVESKEERDRTRDAIRGTWGTDRELYGDAARMYGDSVPNTMAGSSDFIRMDLARMMNEREHTTVVDGELELLCLHDVLDPQNIEEWTALLDVHQHFPFCEIAPQLDNKDREPRLRVINAAIDGGDVSGNGWETPVVWRMKMKSASDAFYRVLRELSVELFSQYNYCRPTVEMVEELGSSLPLFARSLFRPSTDKIQTVLFLRASPEVREFALAASRVAIPALQHFASPFPELAQFLPPSIDPPSPFDTSLPPPSPVAADKSFRRTKMVKNNSDVFFFILKRVEPRCCAPDRCSGRTPATINDPSASEYARTESAITSTLLICFEIALLKVENDTGPLYLDILCRTSTLDCETPKERFEMFSLIEATATEFWVRDCGKELLGQGYDLLSASFSSFYRLLIKAQSQVGRPTGEAKFPCLCDLVNKVHLLEKVSVQGGILLDNARALHRAERIDVSMVERWAVSEVEKGALKGSCWAGEGWKRKLGPFIRLVKQSLETLSVKTDHLMKPYDRYRQLIQVMGSGMIMEIALEVAARPSDPDLGVQYLLDLMMYSFQEDFMTSDRQNEFKDKGNLRVLSSNLEEAVVAYKTSMILSPVGSWASRVNSAAIRLRLANSGSQFYQYSLAIQDCTMALYYCPPKFKFKAHYRRGIALARLQLWKKAILDFEQALLIEPQNPLIQQELTAAKRHLISR